MDPFDTISSFYDLEHDSLRDDVEMYLQFARRCAEGRILVAGVGTGRVALPLASAGFVVLGVDQNLGNAQHCPGEARFLSFCSTSQADIKDFSVDESFSLAILPLDTLSLLADSQDQLLAIASLGRVLEPDGVLVVDSTNPLTLPTEADAGIVRRRFESHIGGETVTAYDTAYVDSSQQALDLHVWYDATHGEKDAVHRQTTVVKTRWVYRSELSLLLALAGLRMGPVYGDYDLSDYETSSRRLIVTATPAPGARLARFSVQEF